MPAVAKAKRASISGLVSPGVRKGGGHLWASNGGWDSGVTQRTRLDGLRAKSASAALIWDDEP